MKIVIFTIGTRGDVQPFLALAKGLQRSGHQVILAASYNFTDWIKSQGVEAYPISFSVVNFLKSPEVQVALQSRNIIRVFRTMRDGLESGYIQANDDLWEASKDAEFIINTNPWLCGHEAAQQRGIPMANAYATPIYTPPTRAFPWFIFPWRSSLGGRYNYLTHFLLHNYPGSQRSLNSINTWRATRLGLPLLKSSGDVLNPEKNPGTPTLYGHSPMLLPKPAEWGEALHVTGYWFLDSLPGFQPSANLSRFLESGPPPVYVGYGSMGDKDPERLTRLAIRALEATGQRGILETGWGGIKQLAPSANVYYLDENVPHDWLFPRVAAVVHHGGAGTTSAGLRAGIPNIVTPFMLDQYGWADLVVKQSVGPRVVSNVKKLTAEKLSRAIETAVNDASMRARAAALGEKIRAENGIARSVEIIERHAAAFYQRSAKKLETGQADTLKVAGQNRPVVS